VDGPILAASCLTLCGACGRYHYRRDGDDIPHLVTVQRGDYGGSVESGLTGSLLAAHATSSAGVAWRHA